MTLPVERFNSINFTREFLRSLLDPKLTPRVPYIRQQASSMLRHYPTYICRMYPIKMKYLKKIMKSKILIIDYGSQHLIAKRLRNAGYYAVIDDKNFIEDKEIKGIILSVSL